MLLFTSPYPSSISSAVSGTFGCPFRLFSQPLGALWGRFSNIFGLSGAVLAPPSHEIHDPKRVGRRCRPPQGRSIKYILACSKYSAYHNSRRKDAAPADNSESTSVADNHRAPRALQPPSLCGEVRLTPAGAPPHGWLSGHNWGLWRPFVTIPAAPERFFCSSWIRVFFFNVCPQAHS